MEMKCDKRFVIVETVEKNSKRSGVKYLYRETFEGARRLAERVMAPISDSGLQVRGSVVTCSSNKTKKSVKR